MTSYQLRIVRLFMRLAADLLEEEEEEEANKHHNHLL